MTSITKLEQQLAGPDAWKIQHQLLQQLQQMELRLRGQLRLGSGVASDQFETIQACIRACMAAQDVVRNYRQDT